MKIAIFADVHGNLLGLEAVLADIRPKNVAAIYCLGDLVGYGPRPNEVIEILRRENIPTIMGNYDDAIGNMRIICGCDYKNEKAMQLGESSLLWTKDHTTEENKAWLRQLPLKLEFNSGGLKFLLVHGSPQQLNEYLFESTAEKVLQRFLKENYCDVLVCGHTHLPYHKQVAGGHVINVGSAGKPKHGNPNVGYALIDAREGNLSVEFFRVTYDFEQTAQEIEAAGLPREFAEIIRTGKA